MKSRYFALWPLLVFSVGLAVAQDRVSLNEAYEGLAPLSAPFEPERKRPEGLKGRVLCGYQGWFRAEGDGTGAGFQHYEKHGRFEPGACTIDLWPDLTDFGKAERFPTTFRHRDGRVAEVFSSCHPDTVRRHFSWMKEHAIDGVFVQRFASMTTERHRSYRELQNDNVKLAHCRDAANREGRCYALMYDLSGLREGDFESLASDWKQLRNKMQLGTDPNDRAYLQLNGKPLVAIWGVGFAEDRKYSLAFAERFIRFIKDNPDWGGASVMLGVPYHWREGAQDAIAAGELHKVLELADVISPWSVGRVRRPQIDAGEVVSQQIADRRWCEERKIGYLPVAYPGFSWRNLKGKADTIPREKGTFLWDQFLAAKAAGNTAVYVAMFDEIDEGTAIFKCTNDPPVGASRFRTYDGLPSDHYLWLCSEGRRLLRGELPLRTR